MRTDSRKITREEWKKIHRELRSLDAIAMKTDVSNDFEYEDMIFDLLEVAEQFREIVLRDPWILRLCIGDPYIDHEPYEGLVRLLDACDLVLEDGYEYTEETMRRDLLVIGTRNWSRNHLRACDAGFKRTEYHAEALACYRRRIRVVQWQVIQDYVYGMCLDAANHARDARLFVMESRPNKKENMFA